MSMKIDTRKKRRLTWMSMYPTKRDKIVLVNDLAELMLLFGTTSIGRAFLFRNYTMSYDELVLTQLAR